MKIQNCKIGLILLLSLSLIPVTSVFADSNSLTQLDIRKNNSSSSAVDITLYTTTPYNDSVAVTKKSDNKYVILMPNVSGSSSRNPDLSGLKDVISNVDIKSVSDATGSYTKVTLITTKPLNIKTHTQKSLPVTAGQKAYKDLIAQSGTHTNAPVQVKPALKEVPKTVVTVNKPAQAVKVEAKAVDVKPAVQKKTNIIEKAQNSIKDATSKKEVKSAEKPVSVVKKTETTTPAVKTSDIEQTVKNNIPTTQVTEKAVAPAVAPVVSVKTESKGILSTLKKYISGRITPNMPITLAMILIPLFGLVLLFRLIKSSMHSSSVLKKSFMANLKTKQEPVNDYEHIISADMNWQEKYQKFVAVSNKNYEKSPKKLASENIGFGNITVDNSVSAKPAVEKSYALDSAEKGALDSMPKIVKDKKPEQSVSKVEISEAVKEMERQIDKLEQGKSENISDEIEINYVNEDQTSSKSEPEYVASLEHMLHSSPDIEKTDIESDIIINELEQNFKDIKVHSEDYMISSKMSNITHISKGKKLKAFAHNAVLEESHRNKPLPKTREEVKRAVNLESKHVSLGYSKLHSNPRLLEGANLSAADLIAKSSRFLPNPAPKISAVKPPVQSIGKPKVKPAEPVNEKGYSMATIDEFFAMTDDQRKVTAPEELSNKVAGSLANIKPSMKIQKSDNKKMSNPISQLKSETKENYINGLIVKSGFNIDKEKGFYLVNLDGEMALIGRIKEEVFVLKKFDRPIEKPLQVRQDNPNVYMVKTDGFRSLVEVNNNKMGVLIEL